MLAKAAEIVGDYGLTMPQERVHGAVNTCPLRAPGMQDFVPVFEESQVLGRALLIPATCQHSVCRIACRTSRYSKSANKLTPFHVCWHIILCGKVSDTTQNLSVRASAQESSI